MIRKQESEERIRGDYNYSDCHTQKDYENYDELKGEILSSVGSHNKALILKGNLNLIETEDQRKEALAFIENCLTNDGDNQLFRVDILAIKKEIRELNTFKSGNWTLFFNEPKIVNPVLDVLSDGTLIVTVPFPSEWAETDKRGNSRIRRDLSNFVLTSNLEVFPCIDSEFTRREVFAKVPETVLRSRWPMKSRKEFLSGHFHRDPFEVSRKISDQFTKYIDFGDNNGAAVFCTLYALLTYFFVIFDSIPYLKFEGMKGSGKSKAGTIFYFIGFNAVMAVSMTAASIFRIVQEERSTLIMDETENFRGDSDKFQEIMPILNSGWQRTGNAPRVEGNSGNRKTVNYSTYSPKIFCSINPVLETLRDRSYVITLIKTLDEIRANASVREKDPAWSEIRSDLYILLFEYYSEVQELAESEKIGNDLRLMGRDWDKAKPLIAMAQFISKYAGSEGEDIRNDLMDFLKQQQEEEQEVAENSIEATIIHVLEERIHEGLEAIIPGKRTEDTIVTIQLLDFSLQVATFEGLDTVSGRFNKKSYIKKIAGKLKSMGLRKNVRVNRANLSIFDCTLSDIQVARQRYKVTSSNETTQTNQTNFPNQTIQTNHTNQTRINYARKTQEINGSSGMISLISENQTTIDETDKTILELLGKSGKGLGPHEIYGSIPLDIRKPVLTEAEIFKRLVNLAGSHPNVKMANMKFHWEASK